MSEKESKFDAWRSALADAKTLLEEVKAKDASDLTADDHQRVDKVLSEATRLRLELDKERSEKALELVTAQRMELSEAGSWLGNAGLVPVVDPDDPASKPVYEQIHSMAKELHDGTRAAASITVDIQAAAIQRKMIRAGMGAGDLIRAVAGGGSGPYGQMVRAALSNSSGLTPDLWSTTFYDYMEFLGGLRAAGAMVSPMNRGNTITMYRNAGHNTSTGATGEGAAASETEDTYDSYDISTAMHTGLVYISRQMIEDAGPAGLMGIIDDGLSRVIARKSETAYHTDFLAYDSTSAGTIAQSYDRTETAGTEATVGDPKISRDNILNAIYGLDEGYLSAPGTRILLKAMTYRHILALTYGTNEPRFIYEPNPVLGAPDQIEGYPIMFDAFLPNIVAAASNGAHQPALAVGNFSDAFHIVDVGAVQMDMSREYRFAQQQVTVLASHRTGGAIKDPRAVRMIVSDGST